MIFTRTWLNEFIDLEGISLTQISKKLNSIGIEVANAHSLRVVDKVVVGFVKEKNKVENADKLSLCKVDVGTNELQIVCGAKNVQAGQYVAVALVGASLPNGVKIQKAKLRGVESEGMICSSVELGLAKVNDGIMVLDESIGKLELGKALNEYALFDDEFIEVELTPNRGDCLSVYGIARELSVAFDKDLRKGEKFEEPKEGPVVGKLLRIVADKNLNSSFNYRLIEFQKQKSACLGLRIQLYLAYIGKIENCSITNLLNYATHSSGVLFNTYDLKTLSNDDTEIALQIRKGKKGESQIYCHNKLLSTSGIYQENSAKINENSKYIIIEASYTNPSVIANAKDEYKKCDDETLYRSFRGSEPQLNLGMEHLLRQISTYENIHIFPNSQQINTPINREDIKLDISELCKCIGTKIESNDAVNILKRLGFSVNAVDKNLFSVKAPIFRSDISNIADICEEIMRVIDIDNIPAKALELTEKNRLNQSYAEYKDLFLLRTKAVSNGYFESIHYVLDNEDELIKLGFKTSKFKLVNPISSELNTLRSTLINHLLNAVSLNTKNSKKIIKLFESGCVFDEEGEEKSKIAFVYSGLKEEAKIANKAKPEFIDFYSFLLEIKNIIGDFSLKKAEFSFLNPYEQALVCKKGQAIGYVGRVHLGIESSKDLQKTYVCELDLNALKNELKTAKNYSKFPQINRDLSIIIPEGFEYEKIKQSIQSLKIDILKNFRVLDLYADASLKGKFSLTINFTFQDDEKTLEDSEVSACMDSIIKNLDENLGLKLR